jgi:hypothetical protein
MLRILILLLALFAGLKAQQSQPKPADKPGEKPPIALKSVPLSKDLADELQILDLAAQHIRAQADAQMVPINLKFEQVRKQACTESKIPDCGITQDPGGKLIVQEKPKPPVPESK